ncbi:cytochrome oxidase maturation protein, cbb3-type [Marinobacterium aestuarii]|uniref:Cytochrome oxidase maturation protein, cbb3-type n=1 Tax=Marinobacterium aestuarii TaxID=1821621 RepID=A0A1A9F0A9_9GAMM|nr:cbb3-type cytochrome oxidase assembly protein CcoS [Marinobacterium aestuarii]ANG63318.1 cytochrome oxidase maturation protein, cbb3-type [Marinobacterium aestuarii]
MDILYLLIPIAIIFVGCALWAFFWSVNSGQYDDMESPAHSILFDDDDNLIPDDAKQDRLRPVRPAQTPAQTAALKQSRADTDD